MSRLLKPSGPRGLVQANDMRRWLDVLSYCKNSLSRQLTGEPPMSAEKLPRGG